MPSRRTLISLLITTLSLPTVTLAQTEESIDSVELPNVTVHSLKTNTKAFQTAAAVSVRTPADWQQAGSLPFDFSDGLKGISGISADTRRNFAQDIQLTSRGSRTGTGVRGIRLYVDGIPATMPDGQGVSTHINMASVGRIEVLKGPFSSTYGNASSGAILVETRPGTNPPSIQTAVAGGAGNTWQYGVQAQGGGNDGLIPSYTASFNRLTTDGIRDHSEARQNNGNLKLNWQNEDNNLDLVVNHNHIYAQDPGGLTRKQWEENRNQVAKNVNDYNARKTVHQNQVGLRYSHDINEHHNVSAMLYSGRRSLFQYLPIKIEIQKPEGHAGGVIDFTRYYNGTDLRWQYRNSNLSTTAGLAIDHMRDKRRGYENFIGDQKGVKGKLRRDETNTIYNIDPYIQTHWQFAPIWAMDAGLRHSYTRFKSDDHYLSNGDDSGERSYHKWLPSIGISWQGISNTNLYAAYSRSFETGTFLEMSYRPDGKGGLNLDLKPMVGNNYEIGMKTRLGTGILNTALFRSDIHDDIIANERVNGRTSYRNAGKTRRQGFEMEWQGNIADNWKLTTAYTLLDARFTSSDKGITKDNHIPGTAKHDLYGALSWQHPQGWQLGIDARYRSKVYVDNANSEAAPSYTTVGTFAGYTYEKGPWKISALAKVNNLLNRDYAATVLVNDVSKRFYEPSPKRNFSASASVSYSF